MQPHFKLRIQHKVQIDNVPILNRFVQVINTFQSMQLVHQIKYALLSLSAAQADIPLRTHCQMLIVNVIQLCRTVRLVNLRSLKRLVVRILFVVLIHLVHH